jgi:hypothetical protein
MGEVSARTQRQMKGGADEVYAFLRDYHQRQTVLPEAMSDYRVEEGGKGQGTVVSYRLQAGKRERDYRLAVEEPGERRLVERDTSSSLVTTWDVAPSGAGSTVTVESRWQGASGIGGFFERTFAPGALRKIYDDLLTRLDATV